MVIDRYKSGFQPPRDIPFEDLNAVRSGETPPVTNQYIKARPDANMTVRGTMSGGKLKRRVALFGIFGSNKVRFYLCFFYLFIIKISLNQSWMLKKLKYI